MIWRREKSTQHPRAQQRLRLVPRERLWRRGIGTAAAALLVSTALVAQGGLTSNASWNDAERVHAASVGALDCATPNSLPLHTSGSGRMLSGSALSINLDTLAAVSGVTVDNNVGTVTVNPSGASSVPGQTDAYADPLNVDLLGGALGINLSQALQLPYDTDAGVYGQYAQGARDAAAGASGALNSSGAINTSGAQAGYPNVASVGLLHLVSQVNQPVSSLLGNISDVRLEVGAVGSESRLSGCDFLWSGDLSNTLHRDYLSAGADLVIDSPAVGQLISDVNATVNGVQSAVDGLTFQVLKPLLENGITGLVNALLDHGLSIGSVTVSQADVSIDLSVVTGLLNGSISDPDGVLAIDLSSGQIRVSTVALLGKTKANDPSFPFTPGNQLNGLAPNTDLLGDARVLATLNNALGAALNNWIGSINTQLDKAVGLIDVHIAAKVGLRVAGLDLAVITIGVAGTLDSLNVTTSSQILPNLGVLSLLLGVLLNPVLNLVTAITSSLVSGVGTLVRNLILGTSGIVRALPTTVTSTVGVILNAVSVLNTELFLKGVVQVLVNAQNRPQTGTNAVPHDLAAIELTQANRFDVAAMRVSVLGALQANDIRLYLARASASADLVP